MAYDAQTSEKATTESQDASVKEITSSPEDHEGSFKDYIRVFTFADSKDVVLNLLALLGAIGSGATLPLIDLVFGKFVTTLNDFTLGRASPDKFRDEVMKYTLYFIYLFVARFFLGYLFTVSISVAATRTTKALRAKFVERTFQQEIGYFDSASNGAIANQVTTNGDLIQQGIAEKLGFIIQAMAQFFSAFIIAFVVQWKLTLITSSIVPAILIVTGITLGIDAKQEGQMLYLYSIAGSLADEVFSTIKTVQSFWMHPRFSKEFDDQLELAQKAGMKKSPNLAILYSFEFFCVYCAYALAFWQGVRMYYRGEIIDPGAVVTVLLAVVLASSSFGEIAPHITSISKAASAASSIFRTMDRESQIDSLSTKGLSPKTTKGELLLEDIHFAYPSRPAFPVLNGLSLSIPANKTTAIVGASGSGKSTVIALLERWYLPSKGVMYLDGIEMSQLNTRWLRTNIRLVQQEPVLFIGTIFENIANGLTGSPFFDVPDDQKMRLVQDASKMANAHDFISLLPQGYHTQVGERANMLSGGQKQRIAIARSIISDPKILLLDEATSALDSRSESVVQDALDKASQSRTTLVIAHKLKTVQRADNIVMMANGSIIEQGTHEELVALGGKYAELVLTQDLGDKDSTDQSEESSVDESVQSKVERTVSEGLSKVHTSNDGAMDGNAVEEPHTMNYSLLRCIFIILREQRELWGYFIFVALLCFPAGFTFPAQALLFARITSVFQISGYQMVERGDFFSLMFFIVALANLISYFGLGWLTNLLSQHSTRRYRAEIFDNIIRQDMEFFDKATNTAGALVSRLSTQPTALQELMSLNLCLILTTIINLISSSVLAIVVGPKMGATVVFGTLPPLILSGYLRIRLEVKMDKQVSQRFSESATIAGEAVSAIRTVSSLALERNILATYITKLDTIVEQSIGTIFKTMFLYSLSQSIVFLCMALAFWYGGQLLSRGEYTTEQFYTILIAVLFGGQAAAQFFAYTTSITKGTSSANYILWLRNLKPKVAEDTTNEGKEPRGDGGVELNHVDFTYPQRPDTKVVKDLSLSIRPGQFAAFVGASGCGKSTLISLLERFYDPQSGTLNVDNEALSSFSPRLYRRNVGLVQQEPSLYQGSVKMNISLGVEGKATEASIEEACRQANILTFIQSLPEGFNTLCGPRGTQLSGGQRQRIAIARALIRKPKMLLLDEATSALDSESEKLVQEALEKASMDRTTIAVAHRLSTIKDADIIFVFERGRVVEKGTHGELIKQGGVYYDMCMMQSLNQT